MWTIQHNNRLIFAATDVATEVDLDLLEDSGTSHSRTLITQYQPIEEVHAPV